MAVELNGKVWKKFVEFFRYEKGYEDWTEDEIECSRNDDDATEFLGWLVKTIESDNAKLYETSRFLYGRYDTNDMEMDKLLDLIEGK